MASSSNSEFQGAYNIFLSFRGLDTRKKFTDHLYEALKREKFQTFRDDDEIERGEIIKSELKKAIENSRMSIIVLSKNYTNSTACLFEIHTILEQWKTSDHMILLVFYEVDPLDIKEQAKNLDFGKKKVTTVEEVRGWRAGLKEVASMAGMGLDFGGKKVTVEEVRGWRAALKEVASMAGMVSGNLTDGYEAKFIEEIVVVIKRKLTGNHLELEKNMQKLKIKLGYLSAQENDINAGISSAMSQPWKRPKNEVEIWLRDVQQSKDDVQRLEQQVVGERNVSSSALLGKHIAEKTQEVTELQEKGRVFGGLLIDELPTGRLLIPPMKDFVKSTKARNTENVWECLMNVEVRPIGVWGMGGIGKTTIMKHIHNELYKEKGKFDTVYWVTVSKAFSITKLQSDIAKALNLRFRNDEDETIRALELYAALSRIKNYVLILDDLWEAFPLARVGIPEPTRCNSCKIVLTTRSLDVCRKMDCTTVKVELLTEQEALTLFLSKAVENDTVLAPEVEVIAAEIAKECARLPLAIVIVAGSLRGLKGIREWRNALNELISSTKDASDDESEVFERLKFSYSCLGNKVLQDCFLYCSLYPEDYRIPVKELIEYWIAEGLIGEMNSVEAKFDKGHAILGKLTSSCLLESVTEMQWMMGYVRLHDLIRDMALKIAASSPRFMVKAGERLKSIPYEVWSEDLDRVSFTHNFISELPVTPPVCPRLTTLLLNRNWLEVIPDSFFTNMHSLEVLNLSQNNKMKSLPESISNLENLHALILATSPQLMYVLPLAKLKALKEFTLTSSEIEELPKGIEELVNLRKLDLSNNNKLGPFPSWKLRRLSKLQYLRIDGTRAEVSAEDLLCLRQLKVVAVHFHNVQELTRYVTSHQLQGLEKYCLIVGTHSWQILVDPGKSVCISSESVPFGIGVDQLVLPSDIDYFWIDGFHDPISLSSIPCLKDARDLRRCEIRRWNGLESIFSSSSFSKDGLIPLGTVERLDLSCLPRFRVLFDGIAPTHNIYLNLKELSLIKCDAQKNIFPIQLLENFPNLERLVVRDSRNVEDIIVEEEEMNDWGHHRDDSNKINLPKLKFLNLGFLSRLKSIYNGLMVCPSIEVVDIVKCPMLRRLPLSLHMDSDQATTPPALKNIIARKEWWESLEWDDPLTKTKFQPYFKDFKYG